MYEDKIYLIDEQINTFILNCVTADDSAVDLICSVVLFRIFL